MSRRLRPTVKDARDPSAFPKKRPPRPRRDTYDKPSGLEVMRYLVDCPYVRQLASELPVWHPGDPGRPPRFPPLLHLIFGAMQWYYGSKRRAHVELRDDAAWAILSQGLRILYPWYPCFQTDREARVTRFSYARFRDKWGLNDDDWEAIDRASMEAAVAQALDMGLMDPEGAGTLTHMSPLRILSGDGVVIPPRVDAAPGELQVDANGALVPRRCDPDVTHFSTGTGERVAGTKWVSGMVYSGHEDERLIFGLRNQPKDHEGGEAAVALRFVADLRPLLPGMQGVNWDKALRGTHIDELYDMELQSIVKVSAAAGGGPKSRRIGMHRARRFGRVIDVNVLTEAGAVGVLFPIRGEPVWVKCRKVRVNCERSSGGVRWYGIYQLPADAPVPPELRGASFRVRYNARCTGDDARLNRAEVIRPVAEGDDEWIALNHGRNGTESFNERLQNRLPGRRAPSFGISRQRFDLMGMILLTNALAAIAFERRTGRGLAAPPPVDAAA